MKRYGKKVPGLATKAQLNSFARKIQTKVNKFSKRAKI